MSRIDRNPHPSVMDTLRKYPDLHAVVAPRPWVEGPLQDLADYHYPTFLHSVDVGLGVSMLGERLVRRRRISKIEREIFTLAGILHDNGKAGLGEPGQELLNSNKVLPPDHELRRHAQKHVQYGFDRILYESRGDKIAQAVANIVALHHLHQPNSYGVNQELVLVGNEEKFGEWLAGIDQAIGLTGGARGGHAYSPSNLPRREVRDRLVLGRFKEGPPRFTDVIDDVMQILIKSGLV